MGRTMVIRGPRAGLNPADYPVINGETAPLARRKRQGEAYDKKGGDTGVKPKDHQDTHCKDAHQLCLNQRSTGLALRRPAPKIYPRQDCRVGVIF